MFDLILRGGRVIDPSQKLDAVTDGRAGQIGHEYSFVDGVGVY